VNAPVRIRAGQILLALAFAAPDVTAGAQTILTPPPNRGPGSVTLLTPAAGPARIYITGTPSWATISWADPVQMRGFVYSVQRWLESDLTCCNAQVNGMTATQWKDEGVQWPGAYIYRITVFYPDGRVGSTDTRYVRPQPVNPANFRGTEASGVVTLRWDGVADVSWCELTGPNIPNGSFQVAPNQTFFVVRGLAAGDHRWTIGSVYSSANAPTPVSSPPSQFPVATVKVPE
jgi:hypothetical protein